MTLERVLITGIAGFIGSTLAECLLARYPSIQVVGIDRFTDYYPRSIKMTPPPHRPLHTTTALPEGCGLT